MMLEMPHMERKCCIQLFMAHFFRQKIYFTNFKNIFKL